MSVAVISKTGERLIPASEYRARKLLKSGKAIKHSYHPFTIQLTERETGDIQPIELCMDTGYIYTYWNICKVGEARISGRTD